MKTGLLELLRTLSNLLAKQQIVFSHSGQLNELALSLGWDASVGESDVSAIRSASGLTLQIEDLSQLLTDINNFDGDILQLIEDIDAAIKNLIAQIRSLQSISGISALPFPYNQSAFWSQFATEYFDIQLARHLRTRAPMFAMVCEITGIIIWTEETPSGSGRFNYSKAEINWQGVKGFLTNPGTFIANSYSWNDPNQDFQWSRLFSNIEQGLLQFKLFAEQTGVLSSIANDYYLTPYLEQENIRSLSVPLLYGGLLDYSDFLELGISVTPIPSTPFNNQPPNGIIISPIARGSVGSNFRISRDITISASGNFDATGAFRFILYPDNQSVSFSSNSISLDTSLRLTVKPENAWILLGQQNETRLELPGFDLFAEIFGPLNDPEFVIGFGNLSDPSSPLLRFVIEPALGDNFISKIFSPEKQEVLFDALIRWSSKHGLSINAGGGFSVEIPIHKKLGPVWFDTMRIATDGQQDGTAIKLGLDASLEIGPVNISIRNIGAKMQLLETAPNASPGLLDRFNIKWDFLPPTGAGIVIESPAVTGGGFLNFDEDTKTYTGAIELSFKNFSLNAFGIIQTQLPDGSDGYSLLIFITSQFQPIQIGMGFTLNGVGGMLGLNRSTNIDFLRAGIRDNTLSNILFPTDVVANISSIISTVDQAFPVQQGRFVFGPMAKIGWGTPTILTIDLGILIEVPDPVLLTIVGVAKAVLPDQDKQTLKLQVNFLGVINFDQQYLSFDASIYDSSLLSFALSGDMALRLAWGSNPNFLLSVGGFHPSYTPPAQFSLPELRRIGVQIFNEDNLRVRFECYFALTSNSAQFGSYLDAYAAAGKYSASALLWFNVLFQFSPFHMLADMGVQVDIKRNSDVILAAFLHASVEGPGPWRVWGEVSFEFLKINFSIHFDKTFGQGSQQLNQSVAVWSKFIDALNANDNWSAAFPDRNSLPVILRDLQLPAGTLLAEPFGNLAFTQRVLPLNTVFSKYGNAPINDFKKFSILNIRDGNNNPLSNAAARDFFASNEFYYLSDEQKLSKPAYELFDAGVTITGTGNIKSCYFVHREYNYENVVIDMRERADTNTGMPAVTAGEFEAALMGNTISQSPLAATFNTVPHNGPVSVSRNSNEFTLAYVNDLSVYGNTPVYFGSETEATLYRDALVAANPNLMNELIIIDQLELVA